jgi:hypothetical protein
VERGGPHDGRGVGAAVGTVRPPVFDDWPAIDSAEQLLRALLLQMLYSIRREENADRAAGDWREGSK